MARTTKAERKRRREAALVKISEGYGFADTVTFVMQDPIAYLFCHDAST